MAIPQDAFPWGSGQHGTDNVMSQVKQSEGFVLVVDDHPVNRLLMDAMLKKAGWNCVSVEGADQAIQALKGGLLPDVIFMDLRMPDIDGFAATKLVREWELSIGHPRIPVIALTADALEESRSRALQEGMDGYLTKPISLEGMVEILNRWGNFDRR